MHLICGLIPKKLLNHEVCEQYDTDKPLGMGHSDGSNLTETIMHGETYHSKILWTTRLWNGLREGMGNDFDHLWKMKKGENMTIKMRVSLPTLDDVLLEKWKSLYSAVFLHYPLIMQNGGGSYVDYVVVTVEKGKDFWTGTITGHDMYGALNEEIWKE